MDLGERAVAEYKPQSGIEKVFMALPEVQAGRGIWQNRHHQWTVYGHECAVVMAMSYILKGEFNLTRKNRLIAGSCLHDIGKPVTAVEDMDDGQPIQYDPKHSERTVHRFLGHEEKGAQMVREMDPHLFFDLNLDQKAIADLVGAHYDPMTGIRLMRLDSDPQSFVENYLVLKRQLVGHNAPERDILDLFYADRLGQGEACKDQMELLSVRDFLLGEGTLRLSAIYETMQQVYHNRTPGMSECHKVDKLLENFR